MNIVRWAAIAVAGCISAALVQPAGAQAPPPGYQGPNQFAGGELYRMTTGRSASLPSVEFGDSWNQDTGEASFRQTDVSLPGNNSLPVEITRTRSRTPVALFSEGMFGDWDLSVPRIEYIWRAGAEAYFEPTRCRTPRPADRYSTGASSGILAYLPYAFYFGMVIYDHNETAHRIMQPDTRWPSTAFGTAPSLTTNSFFKISCLPNATNGRDGFLAVSPDGVTYRFDREVLRRPIKTNASNTLVTIFPSTVTDAHGNTVTYTYGAHGPTRIEASDGRLITLTYNAAGQITGATANGRSWTYSYATESFYYAPISSRTLLKDVTLPGGRKWSFSGFSNLDWGNTPDRDYLDCSVLQNWGGVAGAKPPYPLGSLTATHPNGSRLVLSFSPIKNGRKNDPSTPTTYWYTNRCKTTTANNDHYVVSMAVSQKRHELAEGPVHTWTYTYAQDEGNRAGTTTSIADTKKRTIQNPDGSRIEYDVDRRGATVFEGDTVETRVYANATTGTPLERVTRTYQTTLYAPGMTPMPNRVSSDPMDTGPLYGSGFIRMEFVRFVGSELTARGSDQFTTTYTYNTANSAAFARDNPTEIAKTSNLGFGTRTTTVSYVHQTGKWVLFLPSVMSENAKELTRFTYTPEGKVSTMKRLEVLWRTFTWATDGTMATAKDGINRQTSYSSWKRGYPQLVTQPDATTYNFAVDNNGWITSATNPRGKTTSFTYDTLGLLTSVNRPAPWSDSAISYAWNPAGIVSTETRGNLRTVTTHDGMNRPILVQQTDLTSGGASIYTKKSYDGLGRPVFESWPSSTANPTAGVSVSYDGLGRKTQVQETVAPNARTAYTYPAGNKVVVTDPVNAVTTTTYRAFGVPAYDEAVTIIDPLGATTSFTRDIHGNVTELTQSGTQSGVAKTVVRKFWYDSQFRLCRHRAPEFGDELFSYDAANQMIYASRGETAASGCAAPTAALRTAYSYDGLGRETLINFPGTTPDIARTYDANGNVLTSNRGGVNWTYTYNDLDLLASETLLVDGRTYALAHGYNNDGQINSRTLPGAGAISFDTNGFGQPKSVRIGTTNYITGIAYHPNGVPSAATYGNGRTFVQSLTSRQQPYDLRVLGSTTLVNLRYAYDARRKISSITDYAVAGQNRSFTYDAKGRLDTASGPWGAGNYDYDAIDNLLLKQLGTRTVTIAYNAQNRVASVTDSAGGGVQGWAYDTGGNVTDNGPNTLVYDSANQPTSITAPGLTEAHTYDGNLKRVKTVRNGKTTYWIYSSLTGTPVYQDELTDNKQTRYVSAGGASVRLSAGSAEYVHLDAQGSAIAASSSAGVLLWREHYTPFGEKRVDNAANRDDIGYTGHVQDDLSGLTYIQARYYDPVAGRFLATDPIGYRDQYNLYSYVGNDPINMIDALGLQACDDVTEKDRCFEASRYDPAKAPDMTITASDKAIETAKDNKAKFKVRDIDEAKRTNEKLSIIESDGTIVSADDATASKRRDTVTSSGEFDLDDAEAIIHGHPVSEGTVAPGLGDDSPLVNQGLPNIIVQGNKVGVVEVVNGQYRFRLVNGRLERRQGLTGPAAEKDIIRDRLNDFQERVQ